MTTTPEVQEIAFPTLDPTATYRVYQGKKLVATESGEDAFIRWYNKPAIAFGVGFTFEKVA